MAPLLSKHEYNKAHGAMPGCLAALRCKAASLGSLERTEEAQEAARELRAATHWLAVTHARAHIEIRINNVFKTLGFADVMCRGLCIAGLPD